MKLLSAAMLLMATQLLCGCSNARATEEAGSASAFSLTDNDDMTKSLDLKDFHGFEISSNVDIHYTQGSGYKVEAKGSEKAFEKNVIKVSDGLLVVKTTKNRGSMSERNDKISLYVTSPGFDVVKNTGICNISADKINAGDMSLDNMGVAEWEIKSLVCNGFDLKNLGVLTCRGSVEASSFYVKNMGQMNDYGDVKAETCAFRNSGSYSSKRNYAVSGDMDLNVSGSETFNGKIRARNIDVNVSGMLQGDIGMEASRLMLNINGYGKLSASFKGDNAEIRCSGSGELDMDVDCKKLKSVSGGVAEIVLKGVAEDTSIESSGVSRVDTKGLNNF